MKAITLWQPWATLLAVGCKHMETRSWSTKYRGEILIHASKKPYTQIAPIIPPDDRKLIREVLRLDYIDWKKRIPTGVIIGKANIVDCFQIDEAHRRKLQRENPAELAFGDYSIGRYAWVMADPVLFDNPIPTNGKQRLWNYYGEIPQTEK